MRGPEGNSRPTLDQACASGFAKGWSWNRGRRQSSLRWRWELNDPELLQESWPGVRHCPVLD